MALCLSVSLLEATHPTPLSFNYGARCSIDDYSKILFPFIYLFIHLSIYFYSFGIFVYNSIIKEMNNKRNGASSQLASFLLSMRFIEPHPTERCQGLTYNCIQFSFGAVHLVYFSSRCCCCCWGLWSLWTLVLCDKNGSA